MLLLCEVKFLLMEMDLLVLLVVLIIGLQMKLWRYQYLGFLQQIMNGGIIQKKDKWINLIFLIVEHQAFL